MYIVRTLDNYGAEYWCTGDSIGEAVQNARRNFGDDDLQLDSVWEGKPIKFKEIHEYVILED